MVAFPPCKINLGLNIIRKRPDGYHDLVTCFYPVPWTDVLDIAPAGDFSFTASGTPVPGAAADNLCVRAYELIRKEFGVGPVAMHLLKSIPTGAGLGGGSSDGASALKILSTIFNLNISGDHLRQLAAQLGSDCAFFIDVKPAVGRGRGEVLSPVAVSLKGKFLILVKPEVKISTAAAYAGVAPRSPEADLAEVLESRPLSDWRNMLRNDFETSIFSQFPVIEALQQKLYAHGAVYASMSGSGSAVYGIFHEPIDLCEAFDNVEYWSGLLE